MFPLKVFPESSLAQSVVTTVWVGVFVVAYFNLRLGWPFSGLVVPGYLVPLMIAKPASALVVCLEGFLTYFLVRFLCERRFASGRWSSFFGRDRFFALIVASLLVRIVLDGWILPSVGDYVNRTLRVGFDYRNNLSSFGLIIVALIANQFWKTGFVRGQVPFWTILAITYVVIRYVLMEYTNFNIGNLEYMYENISSSLVASPKAYILLLTSGFIASRLNLLYGWDFNGILIPSLLALEWYHPTKVFTTFLEAGVILTIASATLRLPVFQQVTMEGARKLLLFFNVSFLYKWVLGSLQEWSGAGFAFTDFYGFGYLVPTLIAVKMHDKRIPLRLTRATLQASLTGAVVASLVGFGLTFIPPPSTWGMSRDASLSTVGESERPVTLSQAVREDKLRLYRARGEQAYVVPLPKEVDRFMEGLRVLDRHLRLGDPALLGEASLLLADVGYRVDVVEGRYLYLRERGEPRGWGLYVLDRESDSRLVVEVPAPVGEWAVLEVGAYLFDRFDARGLAVAGSSRRSRRDGAADVLSNGRTFFAGFHRVMGRRSVLQVRGYGDRSLAELQRDRGAETSPETSPETEPASVLWVRGRVPTGVDTGFLESQMGRLSVECGVTPHRNLQRDETPGAFAELVLNRTHRKRLLSRSVIGDLETGEEPPTGRPEPGAAGPDVRVWTPVRIREWLLERDRDVCGRGSGLYQPPRAEELLLIHEEVLLPLLGALRQVTEEREFRGEAGDDLHLVRATAGLFGYRLEMLEDVVGGDRFLALVEDRSGEGRRGWGTYVFRVGESRALCVEVPRPRFERSTLELGTQLFDRLSARFFMLAGSHPLANADGSADMSRPESRTSLFQLCHQAVIRDVAREGMLIVQTRAFARPVGRPVPSADALLALSGGRAIPRPGSLAEVLAQALEADGIAVGYVDGREETAGYEAEGSVQAYYPFLHPGVDFCVLWLSPLLRDSFDQQEDGARRRALFESAGVATSYEELGSYLRRSVDHRLPGGDRTLHSIPSDVWIRAVDRHVRSGDVIALRSLVVDPSVSSVERVLDPETGLEFLVVWPAGEEYPTVFRLTGSPARETWPVVAGELGRPEVRRFIRSRASRLEIRGGP